MLKRLGHTPVLMTYACSSQVYRTKILHTHSVASTQLPAEPVSLARPIPPNGSGINSPLTDRLRTT